MHWVGEDVPGVALGHLLESNDCIQQLLSTWQELAESFVRARSQMQVHCLQWMAT
jgi:hypothetical protein